MGAVLLATVIILCSSAVRVTCIMKPSLPNVCMSVKDYQNAP